jgi:thiamine-monophosphate kinase
LTVSCGKEDDVMEDAFIAALRSFASHPAARGLADDAAVLDVAAGALVLTHDMLVEGVHFLPGDAPEGVAWKLVAVNMSDLAAKGAMPLGVLMGAGLARGAAWDAGFVEGLGTALRHFGVPLLGGDTVAMPVGGPVTLGLTAIGRAPACGAPSRSGAQAGDDLWVTGSIGDAGLGLLVRKGQLRDPSGKLSAAYTHPQPDLALGQGLAPLVHAMADVSDGLLIDAQRMAAASGLAIHIDLGAVPLSDAWTKARGDGLADRLAAATMGDDYRLLFAAAPEQADAIAAVSQRCGAAVARIGRCAAGSDLVLSHAGNNVGLPDQLGYLHGTESL